LAEERDFLDLSAGSAEQHLTRRIRKIRDVARPRIQPRWSENLMLLLLLLFFEEPPMLEPMSEASPP
jgi:hypothetical protein